MDAVRQSRSVEELRQSEARLSLFVQNAPAALAMFDRDLCYLAVSQRYLQIFDVRGDIVGRHAYEVFPEVPERWKELHRRALAGEPQHCDEDLFLRSDLRAQWIKWALQPWTDVAGEIGGLLLSAEDITAQVEAQNKLRESEERWRLAKERLEVALRGTPIIVFNQDLDLRYTWVYNPQLGFESSDLLGKTTRDMVDYPEDADRMNAIKHEVIRTGIPARHQVALHRLGKRIEYDLVVDPLRDESGKIVGVICAAIDITERTRVQENLREQHERSEFVAEAAEVGFWFCDLPFDKLIWDKRVKRHFWLPADAEVTIGLFYERLHPDDRERTRAAIEHSVASHTQYDIEYRTVSGDGRHKWIHAIGRTFYDQNGTAQRFDGVTLDVTEKKLSEERERAATAEALSATAKFRAVFEQTTQFAGLLELDGKLVETNRFSLDACGYRAEEVLGKPFWQTAWWRKHPDVQEKIRLASEAAAQGVPYRETLPYCWVDGSEHICDFALYPILDANGKVLLLHPTGVDITEFKRAEEKLRAAQDKLEQRVEERTRELEASLATLQSEIVLRKATEKSLRELSARTLRLQDEERRRLARDLHDSTGQTLAALKMTLASLAELVNDRPGAIHLLDDLSALTDQALQEIRTSSHLLHPPMLDEVGFASAAQWYVNEFSKRSGILTNLVLASRPQLRKDEEMVFFRILQESLTNVLRHSGSRTVDIRLDADDCDAILTIRDYGKGIPAETLNSFREMAAGVGVGLGGMKQRVRELGGHLKVNSDGGTCILATLPLTKQ